MTDLLAHLSLGAALALALLGVSGFLLLANVRDPINARHPGGLRGRLKDELLVVGPVLPFLTFVATGAFMPGLMAEAWSVPALFLIAGAGLTASLSAPVRRARARLAAIRREPAQ